MAPRDRAYVPPDLWNRPEFRALHSDEQRLYLQLLTHKEMKLCGVVDWRPNRLAAFVEDLTAEHIHVAGKALVEAGLIVLDEETEEALVRTFVRDDGLLKQPNLAVALVRQFGTVTSRRLRGVFVHDLRQLYAETSGLKGWSSALHLLDEEAISPDGDPAQSLDEAPADPPERSHHPSDDPSDDPSHDPSDDPSGKGHRKGGDDPCPTSSKQLATSRKPLAAAAGTPTATPTATPTTGSSGGSGHVEDPPEITELRDRLRVEKLTVRWDKLAEDDRAEIVRLVQVHGVPALVTSAHREHNPEHPAKYAQAWLPRWRELPPAARRAGGRPLTFTECHDHPGQPAGRCPLCNATAIGMPDHVREQLRRGRRRPAPDQVTNAPHDEDAPDDETDLAEEIPEPHDEPGGGT